MQFAEKSRNEIFVYKKVVRVFSKFQNHFTLITYQKSDNQVKLTLVTFLSVYMQSDRNFCDKNIILKVSLKKSKIA